MAHYRFDGDGNTAIDSGPGSYDAPINGSAARVPGVYVGQALGFDGSTAALLNQSVFNDAFTARTFSTWVKFEDTTRDQIIVEEGGITNGWALGLVNQEFTISLRSGRTEFNLSAAIPDEGWHHVAMTFDNGELKLFIDGAMVTSGTAPFSSIPSHSNDGAFGAINSESSLLGPAGGILGKPDRNTGRCAFLRPCAGRRRRCNLGSRGDEF